MKRTLTLLIFGAALGAVALATQALPVAAQAPDGSRAVDEDFGLRLRHPSAYPGQLNVYPRPRYAGPSWTYELFDHPRPSFQYFQQAGLTIRSGWGLTSLNPYGHRDAWSPGYYPAYGPDYYAPPACRPWGRCHRR